MGMFARRKGRAGEQELRRLLSECFGDLWTFERNSFQSRMGGDDMATDAPYSFECKRVETPTWGSWFKQAKEQAQRHMPPKMPVIAHRVNNGEWTFTLPQLSGREFARLVRAVHLFNQLPQDKQLQLLGGKGPPVRPPRALPTAANCSDCGCPLSDHDAGWCYAEGCKPQRPCGHKGITHATK